MDGTILFANERLSNRKARRNIARLNFCMKPPPEASKGVRSRTAPMLLLCANEDWSLLLHRNQSNAELLAPRLGALLSSYVCGSMSTTTPDYLWFESKKGLPPEALPKHVDQKATSNIV